MSFIKAFARLRICLFHYLLCRNLEKIVIVIQPRTRLLLLTMVSVSYIYSWHGYSSFTLRFSESEGMFSLGQIGKKRKKKWKQASCHQPVLCFLMKHAVLAGALIRRALKRAGPSKKVWCSGLGSTKLSVPLNNHFEYIHIPSKINTNNWRQNSRPWERVNISRSFFKKRCVLIKPWPRDWFHSLQE